MRTSKAHNMVPEAGKRVSEAGRWYINVESVPNTGSRAAKTHRRATEKWRRVSMAGSMVS